jgi:hypothetical protein
MTATWIPLTDWPRELARLTGGSVTYRTCYFACVDGKVPAERRGRHWGTCDLPGVAAALGLAVPADAQHAA